MATLLLGLLAAGCSQDGSNRHGTVADFRSLPTNLTIQQVVDRVGMYDRVRGSGIPYYEYDFPNGSAVLVCPDLSLVGKSNPSVTVTFWQNTNEIPLAP